MSAYHSTDGTPRWVKVFGIVFLALVLLFVVLQFVGGGDHGPGRHLGGRDTPEDHRPPPGVDHGPPRP